MDNTLFFFLIKNIFVLRTARNKWFCVSPDWGRQVVRSASPWVLFSQGEDAHVPTFQSGTTESMETPTCLSPVHMAGCDLEAHGTVPKHPGLTEMLGLHFASRYFHQAVSFQQAASGTDSPLLSVHIWGVAEGQRIAVKSLKSTM